MPLKKATKPLTGCTLLYTRNDASWARFQTHIAPLGATALHLPLLETRPLTLNNEAHEFLTRADSLVFPSANAVRHTLSYWRPPVQQRCISIGKRTTEALIQAGITPSLTAPPPFNSEALLSAWQPQQERIAIMSAAGGRQQLAETLSNANQVYTLYVYERFCPSNTWPFSANQRFDVIFIESVQTLKNFVQLAPQTVLKLLKCQATIATISERAAQAAQALGFLHTLYPEYASEEAMIQAATTWWTSTQGVRDERERE